MSLKSCIYCNHKVSEYAVQCPNCKATKPFDIEIKKQRDEAEILKKKEIALWEKKVEDAKMALKKEIKCNECGFPYKTSDVLAITVKSSKNKWTCEKCGFPNNDLIKCEICNKCATTFDIRQQKYVCDYDLMEACEKCCSFIQGAEKKRFTTHISCGPWLNHLYCEKCYSKEYGKDKNRGCFIATAAFDSTGSHEVIILREFRDHYLDKKRWGNSFINFYYFISPPFAQIICRSNLLKYITKQILKPVIYIIRKIMILQKS